MILQLVFFLTTYRNRNCTFNDPHVNSLCNIEVLWKCFTIDLVVHTAFTNFQLDSNIPAFTKFCFEFVYVFMMGVRASIGNLMYEYSLEYEFGDQL